MEALHGFAAVLLVAQTVMLGVVFARLAPGRTRRPPVRPHAGFGLPSPVSDTTVTVVVATLNEASRLSPCLSGLMEQTAPLLEVLVVDSRSSDGTRELIETAALRDSRIRLITDDPLPDG
ncbi:MAG: glycosyltransferase, partial [Gemmatimonas sp.]